MLTKRIIPCLDVDCGRVVKGTSFVNLRDAGDPVELAAYYDKQGADELVFLDITASAEHRDTMVEVVKRVAEQVFIPLTVGGGIRSVEDMHRMLLAGADKVAINTAACHDPNLIMDGAHRFGNQCIVLAIDARRMTSPKPPSSCSPAALSPDSRWEVCIYGGREPAGLDAVTWAQFGTSLGAGEILLTSMDADGHKTGYDLEMLKAVSEAVTVPVIASGGAGTPEHLYDAIVAGKADAVLAASIFHYGEYTIAQVKRYLTERGVAVRV